MAPSQESTANSTPSDSRQPQQASNDTGDLAQAYRDLARGEQAATALEANLSNLESKLDAMLAAFESAEQSRGGNQAGVPNGASARSQSDPSASQGKSKDGDTEKSSGS